MKKICILLLALTFVFCCGVFFVGCGDEKPEVDQEKPVYALSLENYEITLAEGEEYTLNPVKSDEKGNSVAIESVRYLSEAEKIASVKDGKITAGKKGVTYVHIIADGLEVSCFVNVVSADRNGLMIEMTTGVLYKDLPTTAYAMLYENGKLVAMLDEVIWGVSDEASLSIDKQGIVTPKKAGEGKKITAKATYNGKEYNTELTIDILEPLYFDFSTPEISVLTDKTLSGVSNGKGTEAFVTVDAVNSITGERTNVTDKCSVKALDPSIATAEKVGDRIKIKVKDNGNTLVTAVINDDVISTRVTGYTPLSTVADLDALSLKSINKSETVALKGNYMLTNDIDYGGGVMYPIAPYIAKGTETSTGIQWKYILEMKGDKYSYVDRAKVGNSGEGLTDEQFRKFIENKVIASSISFSGVLDGNGYAIKNASVMYDTGVSNGGDGGSVYAVYSAVFGRLTGTIRNIAFTGLKQQDPEKCKYDIKKLYYKETSNGVYDFNIDAKTLTKKTSGSGAFTSYMARGCSLIAMSYSAVIENVFLDMEFTLLHQQANLYNGALVAVGYDKTVITNCVLDIDDTVNKNYNTYCTCGIQGGTNSSLARYENNLAVGVFRIDRAIGYDGGGYKNRGANGNWFLNIMKAEGTSWKNLFNVAVNTELSNFRSLADTIATFNTDIWDINSDLSKTPSLKNGCSIKTT